MCVFQASEDAAEVTNIPPIFFPKSCYEMMKCVRFSSRLLPELSSEAAGRPERGSSGRPSPFCCYDLDDLDVAWLELVNHEFRQMG